MINQLLKRDAYDLDGEHHSMFGGFWIDRVDALGILDEKADDMRQDLADRIEAFIRDGYTILKGAVSKEITTNIRDELDWIYESPPEGLKVETWINGEQHFVPPSMDNRDGPTKLLDYHAYSENARQAIAAPAVVEFLTAIFDDRPKAFQTLGFWNGSQQAIHKDTAYVRITGEPMHIAASWVALEDIQPGTGELEYYVGSHRAPDFLFADRHKWLIEAPHEHDRFLASHHEDAKKYGYEKASFLAEEGDVLIWHADLAHGGSEITRKHTRRSLVTHYTTVNNNPPYFEGRTDKPLVRNGCQMIAQSRPMD